MSEASISENVSWTPLLEKYFAESAEKADGLAWMHGEAELIYAKRRTWIDLPVILGSGAIAFLNAGSSSLFEDTKMASISLGIGSLVVGVTNTIGSYFSWAKRSEGHRIAALSYAKQARFLRVEMGLPRDERMRPGDLIKMVKNDIDRLAETAPAVPMEIRQKFKARFKSSPIAHPEISNGIKPVVVYEPSDVPGECAQPLTLRSQISPPSSCVEVETPVSPAQPPLLVLREDSSAHDGLSRL